MRFILSFLMLSVVGVQLVSAHCEIPCGIYDDPQRIAIMREHVATIEKSMREILVLDTAKVNTNQMVRWVSNKELYASKVQEITSHFYLLLKHCIKPNVVVLNSPSEDYKAVYQNCKMLLLQWMN